MKKLRMMMKGGDEAVLYLEGDIGAWGWTPQLWSEKVAALKEAGCKSLLVRINSPGGSVLDALAIVDCIEALRREMPVRALVCGLCASAATVIACACESVQITKNSTWMVHEPSCHLSGTTGELRAQMEAFEANRAKVYAIYAAATGKSAEQVAADHVTEKYYTAEEAVAYGFCVMAEDAPAEPKKGAEGEEEGEPEGGEEAAEGEPEEKPEGEEAEQTMFARFLAWMKAKPEAKAEGEAAEGLKRELELVRAELRGARAALEGRFEAAEAAEERFRAKVNAEVAKKVAEMALSAEELPKGKDEVRGIAAADMRAIAKEKGWNAVFARLG